VIPDASLGATPLETSGGVASISETERLTAGLVAGDEASFRQFHSLYFDRLYRFLLGVTRGSDEQTQEAMQQTFLRVVRYARVFRDEEVFWSWLKAVARSAAQDNGRKQRRYLDLLARWACFWRQENEALAASPEPTLGAMLEEALQTLDPSERDLIRAKYVEGHRLADLAIRNGVSEKALESRLLRLRRELRARVLEQLKTAGK
jgi:RNA polymerase sigma-70 factor (ECF subfamily)